MLRHEARVEQVRDDAGDGGAREPGGPGDLGAARRSPIAQDIDHPSAIEFAERTKRSGLSSFHSGRETYLPVSVCQGFGRTSFKSPGLCAEEAQSPRLG